MKLTVADRAESMRRDLGGRCRRRLGVGRGRSQRQAETGRGEQQVAPVRPREPHGIRGDGHSDRSSTLARYAPRACTTADAYPISGGTPARGTSWN